MKKEDWGRKELAKNQPKKAQKGPKITEITEITKITIITIMTITETAAITVNGGAK